MINSSLIETTKLIDDPYSFTIGEVPNVVGVNQMELDPEFLQDLARAMDFSVRRLLIAQLEASRGRDYFADDQAFLTAATDTECSFGCEYTLAHLLHNVPQKIHQYFIAEFKDTKYWPKHYAACVNDGNYWFVFSPANFNPYGLNDFGDSFYNRLSTVFIAKDLEKAIDLFGNVEEFEERYTEQHFHQALNEANQRGDLVNYRCGVPIMYMMSNSDGTGNWILTAMQEYRDIRI